ncbi:MAG: hypothetical protein U0S48_05745 [Solirubrobacteraceae bacterium]
MAESRYAAEDASRAGGRRLRAAGDVVVDLESAAADGSPLVHGDTKDNVACDFTQESAATPTPRSPTPHVLRRRFVVERSAASPTRGTLAEWDARRGES